MTRIAIPEGALFGLANLPYGVFSAPGTPPRVRIGLGEVQGRVLPARVVR